MGSHIAEAKEVVPVAAELLKESGRKEMPYANRAMISRLGRVRFSYFVYS